MPLSFTVINKPLFSRWKLLKGLVEDIVKFLVVRYLAIFITENEQKNQEVHINIEIFPILKNNLQRLFSPKLKQYWIELFFHQVLQFSTIIQSASINFFHALQICQSAPQYQSLQPQMIQRK